MARASSVTNGSAAPERKRSTRPWRSCSTKRKTTRRSRHGDGGGLTPETQQQAPSQLRTPATKRPIAVQSPRLFCKLKSRRWLRKRDGGRGEGHGHACRGGLCEQDAVQVHGRPQESGG